MILANGLLYYWFLSERRDRLTNCLLSVPGEHCRTSRASLWVLYKMLLPPKCRAGGTLYIIFGILYYYIVCERLSIDQTNPSGVMPQKRVILGLLSNNNNNSNDIKPPPQYVSLRGGPKSMSLCQYSFN